METLKLNIPNMKCSGCSTTVESHLKKISGINAISINTQERIVEITYNGDKTIRSLIIKTLKGIGYPAEQL